MVETDLETIFQEFANIIENERNANWQAGDLIAQVLSECSKQERDILIGKFAELADCSAQKIKQLYRVARTFPPDKRALDKNWSFHLSVMEKANALNNDPIELLDLALKEGWSKREVAQYCTDGSHRTYDRCSTCQLKKELEDLKQKLERGGL